jgi:hypothetical protein
VLDGLDPGTAPLQAGRQAGVPHGVRIGLDVHHLLEVHAPEHDTGVGSSGAQRKVDLFTGMQADPGGANHVLQRALLDHFDACRGADLRAIACCQI